MNLKYHVLVHTGGNSHKCKVCDKESTQQGLSEHMKLYREEEVEEKNLFTRPGP